MFPRFEQPTERPCTACGRMTFNREWVHIRAGSPRPVLVARCPGECEKETTAREARMLKQIRKAEKRMGAQA